jgi:hypothetical protein
MGGNVSALRNQIGKATLGVLSALLIALVSWGARSLWATKVDVDDFSKQMHAHLQEHALERQLDSVWHAQQGRKMDEVLCTLKPTRCPSRRRD